MRQLQYALLLLVLIFCLGAVGYKLIGDRSLFEAFDFTLITLMGIGYERLPEMSKAERIFEVTIIILGMTIVYISFALIVSYIVESEVSGYMGRRRMEKKLKRLKDHVIVCGYGRMVGA